MIKNEEWSITFLPNEADKEHPPKRSFPLLSGYKCPFCNRMLAAYFEGYMSTEDREYYEKEEHSVIGHVPGGLYVKLENHSGYSYYNSSMRCLWELFSKRGVVENVKTFVEKYNLPQTLVRPLSEKIIEIPGFVVVEDICRRDREMLLFSEDKLFGDLREKEGFDVYWKAKENMGEYLMGLV